MAKKYNNVQIIKLCVSLPFVSWKNVEQILIVPPPPPKTQSSMNFEWKFQILNILLWVSVYVWPLEPFYAYTRSRTHLRKNFNICLHLHLMIIKSLKPSHICWKLPIFFLIKHLQIKKLRNMLKFNWNRWSL